MPSGNMKYIEIIISLLLITQFSFAQQIFLDLQADKQFDTDFRIVQVLDNRPEKSHIGIYADNSKVNLKMGFEQEIKSFYAQYLEATPGYTPLILSFRKMALLPEKQADRLECEASFFIRNGDMLIMLEKFKIESHFDTMDSTTYTKVIEECLEELIVDFNLSAWREHPMTTFLQSKQKDAQEQQKPVMRNAVQASKKSNTSNTKQSSFINTKNHKISFSAGYSRRFGRIPLGTDEKMEEYLQGLNHGFNLGLSYTYFFSEEYGMGVISNFLFLQNSYQDYTLSVDTNKTETHDLTENIMVGFLGPALFGRGRLLKDLVQIYGYATLGYMYYQDNMTWSADVTLTGNTIGFGIGLSAEARLTGNLYAKLTACYFHGKLTSIDDGSYSYTLYESENISHLDIDGGFSIRF